MKTRAELSALYVEAIGYCPFRDDPTITEREVIQTLREYAQEVPEGALPVAFRQTLLSL